MRASLQSEHLQIRPTISPHTDPDSDFVAKLISDHEDLHYLTDPKQENLQGVHHPPPHLEPLLAGGVSAVVVGALLTLILAIFLFTRIKGRHSSRSAADLKVTPGSPSPPPPPPYSPHFPSTEGGAGQGSEDHYKYSGVLELTCDLEELSCSFCAGGLSGEILEMIEQNMKHSLHLPLQSKVTIKPYLDRKEWQGPTLLNFSTSLTLEEHMDMIDHKMILIRKMTDSMTDKVYLHTPSKISNHSLSLYRIM